MKKLTAIALTLILALTLLAACGGDDKSEAPSLSAGDESVSTDVGSGSDGNIGEGDIDLEQVAEKMVEEAIENNSFSVAAADKALRDRGVSVEIVAPVWEYTVDEDAYQAYGDDSHGVIRFTKANGLLEDGEYEAWLKKVFDATAAASDDGYNIQGFSWGDGIIEKTWDEFIAGGTLVQTWSYRYNGIIMDVYVEVAEEKPSEMDGDPYWDEDAGEYIWPEWIYYYNGVQVDIANGLQKGWDETWEDLEQAFEEYEDEIIDALEDYGN